VIRAAWGSAAERLLLDIDVSVVRGNGDVCVSAGVAGPGHDLEVRVLANGLDAARPGFSQAFFVASFDDGGFASTSLRDVVGALPTVRLDADAFARFIIAEPAASSRSTFYRGIERVRGGRALRVRTGTASVETSTPLPCGTEFHADDVLEVFRAELASAVERGTEGRKTIALPLSGGLDSSGLFAILLTLGKDVRPFTIDFEGEPDDRPHVKAMESFTGIPVVRVPPEELGLQFPDMMASLMQPSPLPNTCFELGGAIKGRDLGGEMWMTGAGGDDTFCGDLSSFARDLRVHPLRTLVDVLGLEVPWMDTPRIRIQHWLLEPYFPRVLARVMAKRRARIRRASFPFAGPRLRGALDACDGGLADRPARLTAEERFRAYLESGWSTDAEEARAEAESFTKFRRVDPWFDSRLLAFLARLPVAMLQADGRHRGLYRRAFAGRLPESVRLRKDKGAADPFIARAILAAGGMDLFAKYLDLTACSDAGLVSPKPFRAWLTRALQGPRFFETRASSVLWRLVSTEAFLRRHPW
jgi:asparagine synthase (glutamine-hydrolysing)